MASYNPWTCLYWLTSGKTVGGMPLYGEANRLDRTEALRRYTVGSAWFSGEEDRKGAVVPGQLADLAVLSADYFSVPEEEIKAIESVLTIVGGKVVHAAGDFAKLAPAPLPVLPEWSPVKAYGGEWRAGSSPVLACCGPQSAHGLMHRLTDLARSATEPLWGPGCECFAF